MRVACAWVLVLLAGCFTADLDPEQTGAFACEAATDCPEGRQCVNERCEAEVLAVEVRNPEDEQRFDIAGATEGELRPIPVTIAGTLELVDPATNDEHVYGEGHIVVIVDGTEAMTITDGPFTAGIGIEVQVANEAGPHRVAIVARRNDGIPYDNPQATFTRLFWIDDGTPLVAVKAPWPNASFGLESETVQVQISAINYTFAPPQPEGTNIPGTGHAHIYYDASFPACLDDPLCDANYLSVAQVIKVDVPTTIPTSAEKASNLSAVLRNIDHSVFLFDDDGDPGTPGVPVIDTIPIVRQD